MSFEGTRFEKLESSIKNKINRKRKSMVDSAVPANEAKKAKVSTSSTASSKAAPVKADKMTNKTPVAPAKNSASSQIVPGSEQYTNSRTVYVQGLPFTATEQDVLAFFKDVGEIASVRLPKWHDSGKLRGYGHIEFKKAEHATKALELNGEYLQDRYLIIDRPQVPRSLSNPEQHVPSAKPVGCRTIFIKNLPYEMTEEEISEQFKVYGPIKTVRLAVWNHTGKQKGIGYIDFKREDSAETAVKKSGSISLQGRSIVVDYETGAPKGSFKKKEKA